MNRAGRHQRPPAATRDAAAAAIPPGVSRPLQRSVPSLRARELTVLNAVSRLPPESLTPAAAMAALLRQGLALPPSTIAQILLRLERKGVLQLRRKRPGAAG